MTVTVEIPMALPSAGNLHEHWRHRHQRIKAQRAATLLALRCHDSGTLGRGVTHALGLRAVTSDRTWIVPLDGMTVTLTRVSPRKLDSDNLAFAFKGIRDEVAAYFGIDDADPRIRWEYAQAKGKAAVRIAFDVVTESGAVR